MEAAIDLGRVLDSAVVQMGLRELNKDISFDVTVRRPDEWGNVLQFPHPKALEAVQKRWMPVMYRDKYLCGMDRGQIPEFKQWSVKSVVVEIPWSDADKDETSIQWKLIHPYEPNYIDTYIEACKGLDPNLMVLPGGAVARCRPMGYVKRRDKVLVLGWRHTFERIIHADIPGAGRSDIAAKFSVDLMKYPVGAPEELRAALVEE